ncbi:MAG: TerB family tellurite resistance protein [Gammaproteobacteria bacterium]
MFSTLKEFIEARLFKADNTAADTPGLELAAAVLMLEISLADSHIQADERKIIEEAMQNRFHLPQEEIQSLIDLAEKEVDHAVSLYEFTTSINRALSRDERVKIVELLWKVAFADAVLDKYEEYFVRKIADLLHVSHKDFIRAKHKASG